MPRSPSRYGAPSSFSFGPGPISTALKAIIGANVLMFVATMFEPSLQVHPRRYVSHHLQHARVVDVRHRARTHLGHTFFSEVLFHHRHRRGRADDPRVAAALRAAAH